MKHLLIILLLFFGNSLHAQLNDDFTDGNYTTNPVWTGSNNGTDFAVIDNKLRSNSNVANNAFYLSTENGLAINVQWEFWINLQFSTSGANYADIYVISDKADLKSTMINGFFIRIGSTDDEISLYRRSGALGNSVKIIDGVNGAVGSSNNTIKIRLRRDHTGNFTLEREVVSNGSSYYSEGTVNDPSHPTTTHFGVYIQQSTASFFLKHFIDNIKIASIIADTTPPVVSEVSAIDSNTLAIIFNEEMDSISTKLTANYAISNSLSIFKVMTTNDPTIFHLELVNALNSGTFSVSVVNVRDKSTNVIGSNNTGTFTYTKPYKVKYGDMVINEIFADPTPQIDLPSVEFAELRNNTEYPLSLKNWKFNDSSTSTTLGEITIDPHSLLIICAKADTAEFKSYGKVLGLSPWPSLNNSGEALNLLSPESLLIDSIRYSDVWYRSSVKKQGGWTLERKHPGITCQGYLNWFASQNTTGGTPGKENSIYVAGYDTSPLNADSIKQLTDTTLKIYFNKHLNSSTIIAENFVLYPNTSTVKKIVPDYEYKELEIIYDKKFLSDTKYSLVVENLQDCHGVPISKGLEDLSFKTRQLPPPLPERTDTARIIITEIFADPSPEVHLPLAEFIEIYNPSKDTIDLDKWSINDPTTKASIRSQKILPLEYIILCPVADTIQYKFFGKTIGLNPWPSLNNNSDQLILKSFESRVVDSVSYSDQWYRNSVKKQGGWSMEKIDLTSVCEGFFNWTASIDTNGGSPGKPNSVRLIGYDHMKLMADSLKLMSDSTVKLYFNKHLNSATLTPDNFVLSPANTVKKIVPDALFREVTLIYEKKLHSDTHHKLVLSRIKDCSGKSINGSQMLEFKTSKPPPPISERIDSAKIFITEIFADPSPEVKLPLVEFIEIYNPSKDTIDLDKWSINDPTTKTTIRGQRILPREHIILCPVADTIQYNSFGKTIGLNPWPSLNNNSDQVVLKSFRNRVVDSVAYSDIWYHSSLKKSGGWSIEKIDLSSVCQDLFNWTASIDTSGGTPGKLNSVNSTGYDLLELRADSVKLVTDSTIKLYFNKNLNSGTLLAENFRLIPANPVIRLTADEQMKVVSLSFKNSFLKGMEYQVHVSNVKDCGGNSLTNSQPLLFKTTPSQPPVKIPTDTARIIITEIFADPSPEVHLPLAEFIEIYNPSKDTIDLDKWSINDPTTRASIRSKKILPREYIILCPVADTVQYKFFGKTIGINPWPSLNNSSDQVVVKSFKNRVVDSVAYSDTWYRSNIKKPGGWSLEKIDLSSVCEPVFNWTASIDTNGGTPGKASSVGIPGYDLMQLKADSLKLVSDSTIKIYFNKHLNSATISADNFNLTPANPVKKITSEPLLREVILTFEKKFQLGTNYKLLVSSVKDCSGESISNSRPLEFKTSQPPPPIPERIDTAKIVISEIFADPSPEVGLPLVEFIEIYNPGRDAVDLNKWMLSDAGTKAIIENLIIKPGEYVILAPMADTLLFREFGKIKGISPWPSLGNAGDQITLKSFNQRLVDSVAFLDKWYKNKLKKSGGWSLEKAELLNNSCNGFYNWFSSIDPNGGTPGQRNSLKKPANTQERLRIDSISYSSDSTVTISLNSIGDTTHYKPAHFKIDNKIGTALSISVDETFMKIHLGFNAKFQEGIRYVLSADLLFNCKGERTEEPNNQASFTVPINPELDYPIFINEIFADPSPQLGLPEAEFVELYNPTDKPINLKGMSYGDEGIQYKFTSGEIAAQSFLILCPEKETSNFSTFGKVMGLPVWPSLANEKDVLLLKNNKGRELQRIAYNIGWYRDNEKKMGGYSLEMINPTSICTGSQNWAASKDPQGGTPGKQNSIFNNSPGEPLKIVEVVLKDSITLLLTFNKSVDSLSAVPSGNYSINNGVGTPDNALPISPAFEQVELKLKNPPTRGNINRIEVKEVTDCSGSHIAKDFNNGEFLLAERILKNSVLINEILFNPRTNGVDFIELFNNSKHVLDLHDLSIATKGKDTTIGVFRPISTKQFLFEPGQYISLTSAPDILKKEYKTENPDRIFKAELPPFNNDKGIVLLFSNDHPIDELNYDESMHFPLLKKFQGISLERSSINLKTNEPGNFRSATAASGFATPGYKNSQQNEAQVGKDEFNLVSRTFSPDNDGFEDILQVSYRMPAPGLVANVKIFNDKGIMIKHLLKNSTINEAGLFFWDGLDEYGSTAATGIYFILAEIFDTRGNLKRFRRSFALAFKP